MPQYTLAYDDACHGWYASADGRSYSAETQQQAAHWLAAQIQADETEEERAQLAAAREAAQKQ